MERGRIEAEGDKAYRRGEFRDVCPYEGWRREAWLVGWSAAWAADD